ncbi:hypothetical protein B0H14DRAFT_329531 [Mycena olivaceomarginata]|nr:hypothetical protein B0H14DRAFT_329531 [Mycena olivaceomarginata]
MSIGGMGGMGMGGTKGWTRDAGWACMLRSLLAAGCGRVGVSGYFFSFGLVSSWILYGPRSHSPACARPCPLYSFLGGTSLGRRYVSFRAGAGRSTPMLFTFPRWAAPARILCLVIRRHSFLLLFGRLLFCAAYIFLSFLLGVPAALTSRSAQAYFSYIWTSCLLVFLPYVRPFISAFIFWKGVFPLPPRLSSAFILSHPFTSSSFPPPSFFSATRERHCATVAHTPRPCTHPVSRPSWGASRRTSTALHLEGSGRAHPCFLGARGRGRP